MAEALISCDRRLPWAFQLSEQGNLIPLKYMAQINAEALPETTCPEFLMKYIDIGSVNSNGEIIQTTEIIFDGSPSRARRRVYRGDTIISTVRTYLKAIAYIDREDSNLVASTGFAVLSPQKGVLHPRYVYYWMRSSFVIDEICARSVGIGYPATNASEIGSISIPTLPITKQREIAQFLDRKTAAIDALITKKQRLIELLEEKRSALVNQAVTKGLNLNTPMKDSGIPWIGKIPEHWSVLRLRHLISDKVAGPYGSSLTKATYSSSGYRVYGQQQVIPNDFTIGDYYIDSEKFWEMKRYEIHPGDVLVTVMGTVGCVAVVPEGIEPGIINPRLVRYVVRKAVMLPEFFAWVFRSEAGKSQVLEMAKGVTMDGLNMATLANLWMPVPSLSEQNKLIQFIHEITKKHDALRRKIEQQISILQEYRQSVITAAVTGKLDVTQAAAP